MRVKIEDKWYDGNEQLIMVELTENDKENILNMAPEHTKYCQYPNTLEITSDDVLEWMEEK